MASKLEPCSIGVFLGLPEECHKTTYARKVGTVKLAALSAGEVDLIIRRSGFKAESESIICFHHEMLYLRKYACKKLVAILLICIQHQRERSPCEE